MRERVEGKRKARERKRKRKEEKKEMKEERFGEGESKEVGSKSRGGLRAQKRRMGPWIACLDLWCLPDLACGGSQVSQFGF